MSVVTQSRGFSEEFVGHGGRMDLWDNREGMYSQKTLKVLACEFLDDRGHV